MAKLYRLCEPEQLFLMPPSLREWLPEDHLAYFVSDLVDDLDLSEIEAVYENEERGQPPYHPRMMVIPSSKRSLSSPSTSSLSNPSKAPWSNGATAFGRPCSAS
jgi:hypothetical protein